MNYFEKRAAIEYYKQEIVKEAKRSYVKDILGGVDPTGKYTFQYGIQDTNKSKKNRNLRRGLGVAGGVVGGGLAVPSAISGIMGLGRGALALKKGKGLGNVFREGWKGFKAPVGGLIRGVAARRGLSRLAKGKRLGKLETSSINKLVNEAVHGESAQLGKKLFKDFDDLTALSKAYATKGGKLDKAVGGAEKGFNSAAEHVLNYLGVKGRNNAAKETAKVVAKRFMDAPDKVKFMTPYLQSSPQAVKNMMQTMKRPIDNKIRGALGAVGLSGAVTGASSYAQYGQGNRLGQYMSKRNRKKAFE